HLVERVGGGIVFDAQRAIRAARHNTISVLRHGRTSGGCFGIFAAMGDDVERLGPPQRDQAKELSSRSSPQGRLSPTRRRAVAAARSGRTRAKPHVDTLATPTCRL